METSLRQGLATLVLADPGLSRELASQIAGAGSQPETFDHADALLRRLDATAGIAILDGAALDEDAGRALGRWAAGQPDWSDLPFVVLTDAAETPCFGPEQANVLLLPRVVPVWTLASAVLSGLRARRRQLELRDKVGDEVLRAQNEALVARMAARGDELAEVNRQLAAEAAERERTEQRLRQSQKMEAVGRLTGGIAHDFNNLLSAIMGNIELLRGRLTDGHATRLADNAMLAAERGAKLTGQLLAFSRMQRLALATVDLAAMLEQMRGPLTRLLGPDIRLDVDVAPDARLVTADATQLELALLNLASNARDAMPDGGAVTVSARPDDHSLPSSGQPGQYVVLTVADDGVGMPPDVRDRAFEPFFTTKAVGGGSGLGLSQVYGIAKQSGGVATIESVPGQGATVRIMLPAAGPAPSILPTSGEGPAGDARPPEPSRQARRRESVLVVDDDPDVRRFMVESLDALGYGVAEADDGPAGLDQLEKIGPDIMILDFAMPGMNGAAVAHEVLRRQPGLPILFATGFADTDAIGGPLRDLPLLRKPFRIADLALAVAGALAAPHDDLTRTGARKALGQA